MKTAVIYFSLEGNTRMAAEKIAKAMDADIIELKPVNAFPTGKVSKFFWGGKSATFKEKPELEPYRFHADDYDTVIVGTPLWAGTITPPLRTFLSDNDLSSKRIAAFICCLGGNPAKAFDTIRAEAKQEALAAELTLIDPLKRGENIDGKVGEFCGKIR